MKKRNKDRESDALLVYHRYWDSYSNGDLEAFASTLDEGFEMIGTSESEVCHNKDDGIEFFKAQMHEIVGRTDMRNRDIATKEVNGMFLVNETCDFYILGEPEWTFYSRLRLSTLLHETESGWKVIQQHGSLPDMRVQEGETIAFDKISKENLELRDAVRRRTAELENKNRELAIEAALEKVRAVAMGMKNSNAMLDVCRVIAEQLEEFGVTKIRNVQTAIIDEKIGQYLCYQYFPAYGQTTIEDTEYQKSPVEHEMVRQMLASRDGHFTGSLSGKELEEFGLHRKEENHFPDPLLDAASEVSYCFLSIGEGGLGLSLYKEMEAGVLELFKRFHQVFLLAYQRFQDIQKAEAQTREAQIEVAVERVRAQSMAMHHPDELDKVNKEILTQLNWLQIRGLSGVTFYLVDQDGWVKAYDFSSPGNIGNQNSYTLQFDFKKYEMMGYPFKIFEQTDLNYFVADYPLEKLEKAVFEIEEINPEVATVIKEALAKGILTHQWTACARITDGLLGIDLVNPPSEDTKTIVLKIAGAFNQAYQRFLDLQKAEAQAREAQIEAALERVRAQTMAMHSSEDVGKSVVKMFSELTALGVDEGTRFGIGILNHDNENNQLWTARKNGEEVNMHIGNIDMASHPLLKSARKAWKEQIPFHKYVLEEEDLLDYYQMLNKAPDYKIQIPIEKLPKKEIQHCFIFEHGFFYAFSTREFQPELIQITKRFSALFEQTYRRYLDLVRAEAQAREAEIELALERVRARTMAMNHTEELKEVIQVVFDQFVGLNIHVDHAGFILDYKEREDMHIWLADHQQGVPTEITIPYFDSPHWNNYLQAKARQESFFANLLPFEVKNKFYRDLFELIPELTEEAQQAIFSKPALAISTVLLDNVGLYIEHYSMTPYTAEENAILMRFGKVFQQTYTRFLDLQKAEAQARESQIQLALERVRARTMAMHKSQELAEVAVVLYQELKTLGATQDFFECGYVEVDELNNIQRAWSTRPDGSFLKEPYYLPLTGEPVIDARYEAWKQRVPVCHQPVGGKLLKRANEFVIPYMNNQEAAEITSSSAVPDPVHFYCGNFSHGYLNINCGEPLSAEEESLLARFTAVFEMTYLRFLDLQKAEAQARESQIQLALERVRARTMAMQHSDELAESAFVLFQQLQILGLVHERINIGVVKEESKTIDFWITEQGGNQINTRFTGRIDEPTTLSKMYQGWKNNQKLMVIDQTGEDLSNWLKYLKEEIGIPFDPAFLHNRRVQTVGFFSKGMLVLTTPEPLPDEHLQLLEKFAGVFDLTYTRFSDLKQAEAQAREAQIEAALERVRSRSLAMHNSEDLENVILVVSEQLQLLQFRFENVSFGFDTSQMGLNFWLASPSLTRPILMKVPYINNPAFNNPFLARRAGKDFNVDILSREENQEFLQHMFDHSELGNLPEENKKFLLSTSGFARSQSLMKHTILTVGNYALAPYSHDQNAILKRFGIVFEQAYVRFLDLQKAEAQAREAQIEAALERVRSRSMAMHKSEELKEVIQLLFEQFRLLNFKIDSAQFDPNYKENDDLNLWTAAPGQPYSILLNIPYVDSPLFNSIKEAKKRGLSFITQQLSYEDKNQFFRHFFQHIKNIPAERQKLIFDSPGMYRAVVFMENVSLAIQNYSNTPYTEEENEVLKRFGKTFEQVYTRFLDLQKAEAQALESQIEAALERVRSKTMAMHNSLEVGESVATLFEELSTLGLLDVNDRCGIGIMQPNEIMEAWTAAKTPDGKAELTIGHINMKLHPMMVSAYGGWTEKKEINQYILEGEDILSYYDAIRNQSDYKIKRDYFSDQLKIVHTDFYFNEGCLYVFSKNEFSANSIAVFLRFVGVFGQTYRRYLDLQKAEKQAREAEIQLALERVRARSLAMHRSEELADLSLELVKQVQTLGMESWFCAFNIYDDDPRGSIEWGSNGQGTFPQYRTPREGVFLRYFEAGQRGETLLVNEIGEEECPAHYEYLCSLPGVGEQLLQMKAAGIPFPTSQIDHVAFFKYGYVLFITYEPAPESHDVFKRFANVFEQSYTRFLDLQKAEAQAREAQIQLSLERIRAKAMAMQHSDELSDFLTVLFEQFEVLNLRPVNCILSLFDIENNRSTFRMTGKKGATLIASQEIDLDASPVWKQKVENWKSGHPNDVDVLYIPYENLPEIAEIFKEILEKLPEDERPLPVDYPNGEYIIDGYCKYGYLGYAASGPPSEEEKEITRRIANEFGNVYQRFLDLQKAEAQVREAQIQLSLERIRAKAMAMQHSDELSDFLTVVFEQFHVLNLRPVNSQLSFLDFENNRSIFRLTGKNGATLIATQEVDLDASPVWKQKVEEFKAGQPNAVDVLFFPVEMLPQIVEMFKEILEKLPEDDRPTPEDYPNGQYLVEGSFKYGYLGYSTSRPPTEEEKEITRRITHEFGNVYQRFLDLQKAEAQARESQIQLAMERVRARTMAMQHSSELGETSALLFQQIQNLGVPPWSCGFNIWEQGDTVFTSYMGSPDGAILDGFKIPLTEEATFIHFQESRDRGDKLFVDVLEGETLEAHYRYFLSLPEIKKAFEKRAQAGEHHPTFQINHLANFSHGNLLFITYEPCPEAHDIFIRFAKVFEQTYIRFLDLQKAEAQAREAQIENALEKVRSRTMAMQRSDELTDVAGLLFNQVSALGIKTWTTGFNVWSEDNNSYVDYLSLNGEFYEPYTVHTEKAEALKDLSNIRKSGVEFDVLYVEGEKIKQLYLALSGIDEKEYDIMVKDGLLPSQQYEHFVFGAKVSVMFITYEPVPEAHDIFKRLGKVFEQTYTRFLDLQRAEAQAREAKIETSLEKVRSRTMGMQSSEELPEVANLLFTEVRALGIHAWSCGYNILAEDKKTATCWMSSEGTIQTPFQLRLWGENSFDEMGEFVLSDHTMLVQELGDKALEEHYAHMKSFPDLKPTFDEIDRLGLSLPTYQINHLCKFNGGFILFITYEKVPESHAIFKRFTNVFDQTYTRFLDLKKAEAQARESEIEVALEKVRSRSLAMHKSDELKDVVFSVFERLRDLQIQTDSTNIVVYHDESEKVEFWTANEMNYATKFSLPMTERFYPIEGEKFRKEQKVFLQHLPFEEKNRFWEELFETPDFRKVPEARKNFLLEKTDCLTQLIAFGKFTGIMLNRYFNTPFSVGEFEIAERFAKVFDQAYTRFLDLQKAEAQAREAQIENALEKVRSRSLAMQSPGELIEVARLLREEMGALGVEELETSSIYIQDESSGLTQCWFTIKNPDNPDKAITDQMTLDLQDTWVGRKMNEFVRSKAKQTSILMQGEERIEWIRYCEEKSDLFGTSNFYGETIPDRTYHLYKFSNGYIGAAAPGEISTESWELLKRATAVFSFAYTRFRDLQMAQSSARAAMRQASLDRVRADISSMRNADDLDRITPLVFNELTTLGIPFIRCGVFIVHENRSNVEIYLSTPEGKSLAVMTLPFSANEMTSKSVEAWKKGEVYVQHWNQTDFINWGKSMQEQGYVKDLKTYQGAEAAPESLHLHFVPFAQGLLYVGSTISLSQEQIDLVKALAKSFAIAYARYEDFVKLEKAKAEVESAMSELKATQSQLVQQEKLASLGQLTAGIAHEIKNPLNFVNNFSEVSIEMIEEALEEMEKREARDETLIRENLEDIKSNLQKVHQHGSRANGIVTSMLQHSRGGTGKKEATDLNALIQEYVNLSFHGMRAGKNPINVDIILDLDPEIKEVSLIKEDFSRVIINLCNNAFDAMKSVKTVHTASLRVRTKKQGDKITIEVSDNGPGIPDDIKDKILQPFFTTKKGTEGTGLGLSITHDIVKAHGGELRVETKVGEGTDFQILLPFYPTEK
ncbi:ATP-binding protein [Cognataquiflexum rubidum]|uniref:ATP-binding protein n=1 Tax=Cognataquiflexum rubidum TaxID=2922273 RepID=UPI001F14421B|nr:ATP-binding protein [Cognataquiflexum rubidum]MCH6235766.1 ATP-binding protein [Cognataquiflexum rubidum]